MKELTVKQAIEQGYTKYGMAYLEWQTANDIGDIDDDAFRNDLVLFDKEANFITVSGDEIGNVLADRIEDVYCEDSGDNTTCVLKTIKEIDFSELAEEINELMKSNHSYYRLTDIKLIRE